MARSHRQLTTQLNPPPRCAHTINAVFLVLSQPWLPRFSKDVLANEIDDESTNNADERNWIHPMDVQMEDLHPNNRSPEVAREKGDVEESSGCKTEHDRRTAVEDQEAERVPRKVAAHFTIVPDGGLVLWAVEDTGHGTVDEHAPEPQLPNNFIERPFRNQEFLGNVAHAVKCCAD